MTGVSGGTAIAEIPFPGDNIGYMIHGKAICFVVNLRKDKPLAKTFFIAILYTCSWIRNLQPSRRYRQAVRVSVSTVSRALHNHPSIGLTVQNYRSGNWPRNFITNPTRQLSHLKKAKHLPLGLFSPTSVKNFFRWPLIVSKTARQRTIILF